MIRIVPLVLILVLSIAGCARLTEPKVDTSAGTVAQETLAKADMLVKSGKYAEAGESYKAVMLNHQNTDWAATAQYESALIYLAAGNPRKDYSQALAKLEDFITQHPNHPRTLDARNWRQALKTLLDLQRENGRLNKNIERLKQLDMRQEEKRRGR